MHAHPAEELELTSADYWELPPALDEDNDLVAYPSPGTPYASGAWLHVSFPSAKDRSTAKETRPDQTRPDQTRPDIAN